MEKYRNFSLFIILISTPDYPHFYYMLGGNLGSLLYGDVSVMLFCIYGLVTGCILFFLENEETMEYLQYNGTLLVVTISFLKPVP